MVQTSFQKGWKGRIFETRFGTTGAGSFLAVVVVFADDAGESFERGGGVTGGEHFFDVEAEERLIALIPDGDAAHADALVEVRRQRNRQRAILEAATELAPVEELDVGARAGVAANANQHPIEDGGLFDDVSWFGHYALPADADDYSASRAKVRTNQKESLTTEDAEDT